MNGLSITLEALIIVEQKNQVLRLIKFIHLPSNISIGFIVKQKLIYFNDVLTLLKLIVLSIQAYQ